MAKARKSKSPSNARGSAAAIAKRRAARALNTLFSTTTPEAVDGRTLKRMTRLKAELQSGKNGKPLRALDVLGYASELLAHGETLSSLRKLKPKLPPTPAMSEEARGLVLEAQQLYGFDAKAWKLLGVNIEAIGRPKVPSRKKTARRTANRKKSSRRRR